MKVFISAGEASGDLHAAGVIRVLRERFPGAEVRGIAGPAMCEAGCIGIAGMHELNVMGVVDVIKSLPRIREVRRRVLDQLRKEPVDVAILVDFPGFHISIGRQIRAMGIPVVQYIAPKLWAWGAWRSRKLKASQDRLASILPFEPAWFAGRHITAEYVGNPSAAACVAGWDRPAFLQRTGIHDDAKLLAILPGSRPSELMHHVPLLAEAWQELHALHPNLQAIVPIAPGVDTGSLETLTGQDNIHLVDRMQQGYRLHADAAVAVSGTATLELALWDIPTVLVYRTSPFTVFMARRVVKTKYIGLANLLLGRTAMPELIQDDANRASIVQQVETLLGNRADAQQQRSDFAELRSLLGHADPAVGVVDIAAGLVGPQL